MNADDIYNRCIQRRKLKDGSLRIKCRLGLWSGEGADHAFVEREARHYWVQYHADGEYDKLLAQPEEKEKKL